MHTSIYYYESLFDPEGYTTCYKKELSTVLNKLFNHEYKSACIELKHAKGNYPIFTARLNRTGRLVFTIRDNALIILSVLIKHNYDTSPFFKDTTAALHQFFAKHGEVLTPQFALNQNDYLEAPHEEPLLPEEEEPGLQPVIPWGDQGFLILNEEQHQARQKALPLIIIGAGGAGKTLTGQLILEQTLIHLKKNPPETAHTLVYLAPQNLLVQRMRDWCDTRSSFRSRPPQVRMAFMTPEQLWAQQLPDTWTQATAADFIDYTNECRRRLSPKGNQKGKSTPPPSRIWTNPQRLWDEWRNIAGLRWEDYQALGLRHSIFGNSSSEEERQEVFQALQNYLDWLQKHQKYDSCLMPFSSLDALHQRYGSITLVIDESHTLSRLQHNELLRWTEPSGYQIAYCYDPNQGLLDDFSQIKHLLRQDLGQGRSIQPVLLPGSYRCPDTIVDFAERIIKAKAFCIGGTDEIHHYTSISRSGTEGGGVLSCTSKEELLSLYASVALDAECVILTATEFVEEAKELFQTSSVFTVEAFQGSAAKKIVLYKILLPNPVLKKAVEFLPQDLNNIMLKPHAPKDAALLALSRLFNLIFTAVTRASDTVILVEHAGIPRRLAEALLATAPTIDPNTAPILPSKPDAWIKQARYFYEQGHQEQALGALNKALSNSALAQTQMDAWKQELHPFPLDAFSFQTQEDLVAFQKTLQRNKNLQKQISLRSLIQTQVPDASGQAIPLINALAQTEQGILAISAYLKNLDEAALRELFHILYIQPSPTTPSLFFCFCQHMHYSLWSQTMMLWINLEYYPQITEEILYARQPDGRSSLWWLASSTHKTGSLQRLFEKNSELFKSAQTSFQAFFEVSRTSILENDFCISPFYLLAQQEMPQGLLHKIASRNPDFLNPITLAILCFEPVQSNKTKRPSALSHLVQKQHPFLTSLYQKNRKSFAKIPLALWDKIHTYLQRNYRAWFLDFLDENTSTEQARETTILQQKRSNLRAIELYTKLKKPASLQYADFTQPLDEDTGSTPFFTLAVSPLSEKILECLFDVLNSEGRPLVQQFKIEDLTTPVRHGIYYNTTTLYALSAYIAGHQILSLLFGYNPKLIDDLCTKDLLCGSSKSKINVLYWLSLKSSGRAFLLMLLQKKPKLFQNLTLKDLMVDRPHDDRSILYQFSSNDDGIPILVKIVEYNPKLLQGLSFKDLMHSPCNGKYGSIFYWLCYYTNAIPILVQIFKQKPELLQELSTKNLTDILEETQTSALYELVLDPNGNGVDLLTYIFQNKPGLVNTLNIRDLVDLQLCRQSDKDASALYWLSKGEKEVALLTYLFEENPNLIQDLNVEDLISLQSDENVSALYWLSTSTEGARLLLFLLKEKPSLIQDLNIKDLITLQSQDNASVLYWLASSEDEIEPPLVYLLKEKPSLIQDLNIEDLMSSQSSYNLSVLYWLSTSEKGAVLLIDIFKEKPNFIQALTIEHLTTCQDDYKLSILYWLSTTIEGRVLLTQIFKERPDLIQEIKTEDLMVAHPEDNIPLVSELAKSPEGTILLDYLREQKPDLIPPSHEEQPQSVPSPTQEFCFFGGKLPETPVNEPTCTMRILG